MGPLVLSPHEADAALPRRLVLSHTQLEAAVDSKTGCWRRWWFFWGPPKLPKVRRTTQTFGEVGHGIIERWLKCDDLGNGPELYPEGWALTLNVAEQDLVKRLVEEAIAQGIIRRVPGRLVEHPFTVGDVTGRIDFAVVAGGVGEVTDHKFLKSLKYAPSKESLKSSGQHLLYVNAMAAYLRERNEVVPDQWDIAVNAFSKDPEDFRVKRIQARVSLAEAQAWWASVIPSSFEEATRLRGFEDPFAWRDVPGPRDQAKACNAYGGCAARAICAGAETIPAFTKRVLRLNDVSEGEASSKKAEPRIDIFKKSTMGKLFDERIKNRAAQVAATPASMPPPFPKDPEPAPVVGAPWADPSCRACGGTGISSKGEACSPCVGVCYTQKRMNDMPHLFDIVPDGNGSVSWVRKPVSVPIPEAPPPEAKPKIVEQVAELQPEPEATVEDDPPEADGKRSRGRPKKGITLYLDCQPIKGRGKVRRISDVLTEYGDQLVEGKFWDFDVWKRRDLIRLNGDLIAQDLGSATIAAFGLAEMPDERVLYEALEPFATEVVAAVGMVRVLQNTSQNA